MSESKINTFWISISLSREANTYRSSDRLKICSVHYLTNLKVNTYWTRAEVSVKNNESERLTAATVVIFFRHQQHSKNNANITIISRWEILELLQLFCHGNVIFKFMKIVAAYIVVVGFNGIKLFKPSVSIEFVTLNRFQLWICSGNTKPLLSDGIPLVIAFFPCSEEENLSIDFFPPHSRFRRGR